jgi:hypothetical protein
MADHGNQAVQAARRVDDVTLDYSVSSLTAVDRILGGFHDEHLSERQIGETIFAFGAYVGEVIVRAVDATWVTVPDDHPLGRGWPMVELAGGALVNPIGKAFKRVGNGASDSIPYFYSALVERRS